MKKTILTNALLLTLSQIGFGQSNIDKNKLDNYFSTLEENNKFMGSVAVSKNGEIIYTKSTGLADVENKIKATENSKYRIGSISKDNQHFRLKQQIKTNLSMTKQAQNLNLIQQTIQ